MSFAVAVRNIIAMDAEGFLSYGDILRPFEHDRDVVTRKRSMLWCPKHHAQTCRKMRRMRAMRRWALFRVFRSRGVEKGCEFLDLA